jgi:lipopolysaccharide biosynthesis glycosyltransferase
LIIVTAANDKYAKYLGVMLISLLRNTDPLTTLSVYILDGSLSVENKLKLTKIMQERNIRYSFIEPNKRLIQSLPTYSRAKHISKEAYYRIFVPDLITDTNITKCIYLDCDLIVAKSIDELWNTDIHGYLAAAVDTACLLSKEKRVKINRRLFLPKDASYFNSGVLLMNLAEWRKHRISQRVIDLIRKETVELRLIDQDALNIILHGKWLKLDPKWNYTDSHWVKMPLINPAIIHFTGPRKPWNEDVTYKDEYEKYEDQLAWETL